MKRFRYFITSAIALSAVIAGLATAAGGTAQAAVRSVAAKSAVVSIGIVPTAEEAGYQASDPGTIRRFRYVKATSVLNSAHTPYAGIGTSVQLGNANGTWVLGVSTSAGGTTWNPVLSFERKYGQGGCATTGGCFTPTRMDSPAMPSGDKVTRSLYYSYITRKLSYNVTDLTSGDVFSGSLGGPSLQGVSFTFARIGTEFGIAPWLAGTGYVAPPAAATIERLTDIRFTARNGQRGWIGFAPWKTSELVITTDGKKTSPLVVAPTLVPAGSHSFATVAEGATEGAVTTAKRIACQPNEACFWEFVGYTGGLQEATSPFSTWRVIGFNNRGSSVNNYPDRVVWLYSLEDGVWQCLASHGTHLPNAGEFGRFRISTTSGKTCAVGDRPDPPTS